MSSPQNPDDDAPTSGPLDGPTTQYRVPTPPGAPPSAAPNSPPPPSAPPPGPSAQTTQYLRPPTPSPTAAPTKVHPRTSPPSGPPPQAAGQVGHPPPGQRSRQAPPPVQSIPPAPPRHQAPDAGGPGQAPTVGQQAGPAPAGHRQPPQGAPFTPPGPPSGANPGAPASFGPPPGQANQPAAQQQSASLPAMTGSSALAQPGTVPVADGQQMKRRNTIAVWLGLPIITLGIYTFVWYYKIHKEMAAFDRRKEIPVAGPMLVILFLGWTVIAPIISFNNTGKRIRDAQRSAGLAETCSPLLCWLLMFAFGLHTWYMQSELNKVIDRYGAESGTTVPLFA
ncbi:DUF4234 domain-containing protein [Gordonia sp. VNQ95]|uniref:DUF4234 domain-containing protein n=1 Tax=Gordonia sp. VNQ95 TaxID=3156619 RepID=UPI0032B5D895